LRVVVDWDGTITVRDSLVQVIHEFGDPALLAELEPRVGVDLTLHEEIALEFKAITTPLDEVARWVVRNIEVRPGLRELAELEPIVISAGFAYADGGAARAADRIFARDSLAPHLDRLGVAFEPFYDLHDIAAALT